MHSTFREDSFYRRGLVLGLTLAEIIILVIFILLLTLSVFVERKEETIKDLTETVAGRDKEIEQLQAKMLVIEDVIGGKSNINDLSQELVLNREENEWLKKELAALTEENKTLGKQNDSLEKERDYLSKENESFEQIWRALTESGDSPDETLGTLIETAKRYDALEKVLSENGFPANDPETLQQQLGDLQTRLADAEKQRDKLKKKSDRLAQKFAVLTEEKGQYPPCWYTKVTRPNKKPRERALYIFDIRISDNNVFVKDIPAPTPEYELQKSKLPFSRIALNRSISFGEFLKSFKPLTDAGDNGEVQDYSCKFYVKVWDATRNKKDYRRALEKVVEFVFFTYLVEDEPWPY